MLLEIIKQFNRYCATIIYVYDINHTFIKLIHYFKFNSEKTNIDKCNLN